MSAGTRHPDRALSRARVATRLQFMALGVIAGTWGAHIPSLKDHYALGEAMLSIVLLAAGVGTVSSLFVAGRVIGAFGARQSAALAAIVMTAMLGLALEFGSVAILLPAMFVFGAAGAIFDVSVGSPGTELEFAL